MNTKLFFNSRLYTYNQFLNKYDNIDKDFLVNSFFITKLDYIRVSSYTKTSKNQFFLETLTQDSSVSYRAKTLKNLKNFSFLVSNLIMTLRNKSLYLYFEFLIYTNYKLPSLLFKKVHYNHFFIKLSNYFSFFHSKTLSIIQDKLMKNNDLIVSLFYKNLSNVLLINYHFIPICLGE